MSTFNINATLAHRLREFIASDLFQVRSGVAKSEYWKHFSDQLRVTVGNESVQAVGRSGFYVPASASRLARLSGKAMRGLGQPSKVARWLTRAVTSKFELPRLMPYDRAFDAVMNSLEVSIPILSPHVVDHRRLAHLLLGAQEEPDRARRNKSKGKTACQPFHGNR